MNDINIADVDALVRDIFLAFVRVHVLYHAADGPVYWCAMMEELARHGYEIGPGTMYPTLHALRRRDIWMKSGASWAAKSANITGSPRRGGTR